MKKPVFFISSTIYDFSDLRSSIKYFLEQQGCEVLTSETNDFKKPLDTHTYNACLEAMQQADYFILLVGTRVGGWYNEDKRISITQQEYREAYKLHKSGKLQIINFVRSEIWNLRDQRKDLHRFVKNANKYNSEQISSITNHPTSKVKDPRFITDFINEIGRNSETKEALNGNGKFPTGNWIHIFQSFKDIADVLTPLVFNGIPLEDAILRKLLLSELREMLSKSLVKLGTGNIYSPAFLIQKFYEENDINLDTRKLDHVKINTYRWDHLSTFSYSLLGVKIIPLVIKEALLTGTFLNYDNLANRYVETPIHKDLAELVNEINEFTRSNNSEALSVVYKHSPINRYNGDKYIEIKSESLFQFLYLILRWSNIIEYSRSIVVYLEGGKYEKPHIWGKSQIPEMNKELKEESVTTDELNSFLYNEK